MAVVAFIRSGLGVGGGDVTPTAVNWNNITNVGNLHLGIGHNLASAQTLAAIDSPVQLKAAWTSTSALEAVGVWIKNGTAAGVPTATPAFVNASVGDVLYFWMTTAIVEDQGNFDTGTVTVTNESDSAATLDTFTFSIQYVPPGSGGGGEGGGPGDPP